METAIVMSQSSFPSKNDPTKINHMLDLGNGDSIFVKEEELKQYPMGTMVGILTKKYQDKDGAWKTSKKVFDFKAFLKAMTKN